MMNNAAGARGSFWRGRALTVIGLAVAAIVALAAPAFAHPVFSNDEPGFPNPMGGTGGPGQTPPYPAGSRPTLNMFLPFEQDGVVYKGAENTTVDVRVTLPTAWRSPACGPARTSPPVGYRQLGTVVAGWSCAIETVNAHQVVHWSGPQVSSTQTHDDSAQFFTFQATMPSPATQTSYGATGGPEGIHVKQVYASGATSLWTPPNDPTAGETAPGIVRTVGRSTTAPSTPPPASAPIPAPKPGGTAPGGATQGGTTQGGPGSGGAAPSSPAPPPPQGGNGPVSAPAAGAPPSAAAAGPPSAGAPNSPQPTLPESSPGAESQPTSVEQLTQRDSATGQGLGWWVWVGLVLGSVLVAGGVGLVIKRRRRPS